MKKEKLSNRDFARSFDSVAETFDSITNTYTSPRRYREIIKYVKGRCLEVGAGTGSIIPKNNKNSNPFFMTVLQGNWPNEFPKKI